LLLYEFCAVIRTTYYRVELGTTASYWDVLDDGDRISSIDMPGKARNLTSSLCG